MIEFKNIGLVPYGEAWELQKELFEALLRAKAERHEGHQMILFVEHPPVYTIGKSGKESNLLVDEEWLQAQGAQVYHIERGGDVTFHGEGQQVIYPILDLGQIGIGLREYIERLEEAIIRTIARWNIKGERIEGASGVWIDQNRKICAVGVRSSRYVTMHGAALNVNTDLRWFDYINPCGFTDKGVTSMARETGNEVDMAEVRKVLEEELRSLLNGNDKK